MSLNIEYRVHYVTKYRIQGTMKPEMHSGKEKELACACDEFLCNSLNAVINTSSSCSVSRL